MTEETAEQATPLTFLAEDEIIFRDSVREFAEAQVRPLVREMDEHAKIPRALVDELFELGVMGIEIPESLRRLRRDVLPLRCSRSKSCPASTRRLACSSTCRTRSSINALLRWGNDEIKRRYLPRLAAHTVGAYALSEAAPAATRSR